jgi:putative transposase
MAGPISVKRKISGQMLSDTALEALFERLGMSEVGRDRVRLVRASPPAREARTGRGRSVSIFASIKMGRGIQAESRTVEFPACYCYEHDPGVLEFWDQPYGGLSVAYEREGVPASRGILQPDYLVIRSSGIAYEEWKPEHKLQRLAVERPDVYRFVDGAWCHQPARAASRALGLNHFLRSSSELQPRLVANLKVIDAYRSSTISLPTDSSRIIVNLVAEAGWMTMSNLLERQPGTDRAVVFNMLADGDLVANLSEANLLQPETVVLAITDAAVSAQAISEPAALAGKTFADLTTTICIGSSLHWDGARWRIVNLGRRKVGLQDDAGHTESLAMDDVRSLLLKGDIVVDTAPAAGVSATLRRRLSADEHDLLLALRRLETIKPGATSGYEAVPASSRWRRELSRRANESEEVHNNPLIGLLPRTRERGNRTKRFPPETYALFDRVRKEHHLKRGSTTTAIGTYSLMQEVAFRESVPMPSYWTICQWLQRSETHEEKVATKGWRAAYGESAPASASSIPAGAERSWQRAYIDFTKLDVELVSEAGINLGRPWLGLMLDEFSRWVLASIIDFNAPSGASCMALLRECVRTRNALPDEVIVDKGPEFNNAAVEGFLINNHCHMTIRPSAEPRFGAPMERMFGTVNTSLVHQLRGSTRLMKDVRMVSRGFSAADQAIWQYAAFQELWALYLEEIYGATVHSNLNGRSPLEAFQHGIEIGGARPFIAFNEQLVAWTMAVPPRPTVVVGRQGVRILNLLYWCDHFRDRTLIGTQVKVRYDPEDRGRAFVWIGGQWRECVASLRSAAKGRSHRELRYLMQGLAAERRGTRRKAMTQPQVAALLQQVTVSEKIEVQRLRDREKRAGSKGGGAQRALPESRPPWTGSSKASRLLPTVRLADE